MPSNDEEKASTHIGDNLQTLLATIKAENEEAHRLQEREERRRAMRRYLEDLNDQTRGHMGIMWDYAPYRGAKPLFDHLQRFGEKWRTLEEASERNFRLWHPDAKMYEQTSEQVLRLSRDTSLPSDVRLLLTLLYMAFVNLPSFEWDFTNVFDNHLQELSDAWVWLRYFRDKLFRPKPGPKGFAEIEPIPLHVSREVREAVERALGYTVPDYAIPSDERPKIESASSARFFPKATFEVIMNQGHVATLAKLTDQGLPPHLERVRIWLAAKYVCDPAPDVWPEPFNCPLVFCPIREFSELLIQMNVDVIETTDACTALSWIEDLYISLRVDGNEHLVDDRVSKIVDQFKLSEGRHRFVGIRADVLRQHPLQLKQPATNPAPVKTEAKTPKGKRGRKTGSTQYDPKHDESISVAHRENGNDYEATARALGIDEDEVRRAVDRHRQREKAARGNNSAE